ncbi:hypothetical protein BDF19DRAFT_415990 [Syncephalis fuscata]|nr:hypothetical protein BDF19DRAFT_415990 [Syncephalis fuscata]
MYKHRFERQRRHPQLASVVTAISVLSSVNSCASMPRVDSPTLGFIMDIRPAEPVHTLPESIYTGDLNNNYSDENGDYGENGSFHIYYSPDTPSSMISISTADSASIDIPSPIFDSYSSIITAHENQIALEEIAAPPYRLSLNETKTESLAIITEKKCAMILDRARSVTSLSGVDSPVDTIATITTCPAIFSATASHHISSSSPRRTSLRRWTLWIRRIFLCFKQSEACSDVCSISSEPIGNKARPFFNFSTSYRSQLSFLKHKKCS